MYQINDVVVYENGGVCKIKEIGVPEFLDTKDKYYIMQPVCNTGDTIYVKVNNEKMRSVISKGEAEELLSELPAMDVLYDPNDKIREKEYRSIIKSCECSQCFRMLLGISKEQKRRIQNSKRLNMNDDKYLQKVEKLLSEELSVVFNIPIDQAKTRLIKAIPNIE